MYQYLCSYHPDRRAQGVCMSCRKVICSECSTKVEGVNHCRPCLEDKATRSEARGHPVLQHLSALLVVLLLMSFLVMLLTMYGTWD